MELVKVLLFVVLTVLIGSTIDALRPVSATTDDQTNYLTNLFAEKVSGHYASKDGDIEIQFPNGWSGIAFLGMPIVSPDGFDLSNYNATNESRSVSSQKTVMVIFSVNRTLLAKWGGQFEANFDELAENSTATSKYCSKQSYSFVLLNGVEAMKVQAECGLNEYHSIAKGFILMTDKKLVMVLFAANNQDSFSAHEAEFNKSVLTLKARNAVPLKTALAETLHLRTEKHEVLANNSRVELELQSNSRVSEFRFDEGAKQLSFRVDGDEGTAGYTSIAVDKVLQPPYAVTIDGKATTDFEVVHDELAAEDTIQISYHHSSHEVAITGTNVVPEFPSIGFAVLVMAIGMALVINRTKVNSKMSGLDFVNGNNV